MRGLVLVIVVCTGCLDAPDRPPARVLLGDPRTLGCTDGHDTGVAEASSFVATFGGRVSSLSLNFGAADTGSVVLALYDDDGTNLHPHRLMATATATFPSGTAGTARGTTDLHPNVVAGTRYWIAGFCPFGVGTACEFLYTWDPTTPDDCSTVHLTCAAGDASCTQHSLRTDLTTPPDPWASGTPSYGLSVNAFWASDD